MSCTDSSLKTRRQARSYLRSSNRERLSCVVVESVVTRSSPVRYRRFLIPSSSNVCTQGRIIMLGFFIEGDLNVGHF